MTLKLKSAQITNFKSLGDVTLNLNNLTIIVGANSSGKSNCLQALSFLRILLLTQSSPPIYFMDEILRLNAERMSYQIIVEDEEKNHAEYSISVQVNNSRTVINQEYLKVNGIDIIELKNGKGNIKDENGQNIQKYISDGDVLALRTAGNYGNKPFTKKLASYIKNWNFYNIDPAIIRSNSDFLKKTTKTSSKLQEDYNISLILNSSASNVYEILEYWAINQKDKFHEISQELYDFLNINLTLFDNKDDKPTIKVIEENSKEISLLNMSDGTLRAIAYLILLYQSDMPTLIGIEEPERNFHPGILQDVASILKRISKRTQVIFTTHSSQLLDCFSSEEISSDVSVILLSKKGELGTKACLLDKLAESRHDLLDWMNDFGLGSAVYHSHLIEDILAS